MTTNAEDHLAIMQLIARYYQAIDGLDFPGWAACFAEGGRFEGAFEGYDAHAERDRFEQDARKLVEQWPSLRHHATTPVFTINGDTAEAESNFFMTTVAPGDDPHQPQIKLVMAGRYIDAIERTPAGWRFRTRRSVADPAGSAA